jgi:NTP pyrophosphatase (non-canonical NTP hydrolase)
MTRLTNFEKVRRFNEAFQIEVPSSPRPDLFTTDPALVRLKRDLILEEVLELGEAIDTHDAVETADALLDILYVTYGAGIAFGLDMDKGFDLVHESNMSKLCSTEEIARETVEWYEREFSAGRLPYDTPAYRHDASTGMYIVFNKSTGKILKSVRYHPVDLKELSGLIGHTI